VNPRKEANAVRARLPGEMNRRNCAKITFAGFRIYPAIEREKYSAPARDHPLLDTFSLLHHQWTA